jgi:hypothetical protein
MPGRKHGNAGHHKPYKGPWPEEHSGIPGRAAKTGKEAGKPKPDRTPQQTPVHKIPPPAPK